MSSAPRTVVLAFLLVTGCFDAAPVAPTDGSAEAAVPDWQRCSGFGACVLRPSGCCEACGVPSATDVHAVRGGATPEAEHREAVCPTPETCSGCVSTPNPALFPLCVAAQCEVFDVRAQPLSACTANADCTLLRRACCACEDTFVAVRANAVELFRSAVCDPSDTCTPCADPPPAELEAFCAPDGHCDVRSAP